jgi:ubiquitin-small subunit ribosomal protein S27Ae
MADDKKPKGKEEKPAAAAAPAAAPTAAPAKAPSGGAKPKPGVKPKAKSKELKSQKWKRYELTGDKAKKKSKVCPKCGDGVFLAHHANRDSCGKCGYTEFRKV